MVAAYSDGFVKVFELLDPLELKNWQLQVWEFDPAHQRWLPVAELALPGEKGDQNHQANPSKSSRNLRSYKDGIVVRRKGVTVRGWLFTVDPWAPNIVSESIASQLFAASLFPYVGFLYFITKSKSAPKLTLFGFYFLLAFVGATKKVNYGTSLSNVDLLHGGAESLLVLTNLFIVLGLRQALRKMEDAKESTSSSVSDAKMQKKP
ncbi:WRKY transcription factor 53 family protein [Hibiscus syriacus]|uniref:WRKY transcription factor 53 family protein n=1 Tax=Hibiscus syriacus TaxID=106335 RepID=A0A6A2YWH2_HIBSY|nr:WRKY transcription factor 53 family protein [Hibiscus syriacus]